MEKKKDNRIMGNWKYRITHIPYLVRLWWFLKPFRKSHHSTFLGENVRVSHPENVEIGENVQLCRDVELCVSACRPDSSEPPLLKIGNNVRIGEGCRIGCSFEITIEDNVLFAPNVHISDRDHDYSDVTKPINEQPIVTKGAVRIGEGSWLGLGCQIYSGVTIGKHCVVGGGSIVTHSVPDFCVVAGNPARIIKRYNKETSLWEKV